MFRVNSGHAARSANMAPKAGGTCADLIAAAKLLKKIRRNDRRRSERPPSAASLESGVVVIVMMMVMMMVMTVVVVAPRLRHCFFRRCLFRLGWRGASLRRGGDRGESDSGGHKHSHENFIHHFYLL
jgi:hypothetical protein